MTTASPRQYGFTIIELMVVVTVLGVLAAVAFPSYSWVMATTRMKATSSNLHLALLKARSEAVKRNARVVVARTGGAWQGGWEVRADTDNDGAIDDVIRTDGVQNLVNISSSVASVTYLRSGRPQTAATFTISDVTDHADDRCVSIGLSGMPITKEDAC